MNTKSFPWLPHHCYPIDYTIDRDKFNESVEILLKRLSINYDSQSHFSINLSHLPKATGTDRWQKFTGYREEYEKHGVTEKNFTEDLEEIKDLYIGQVISEVRKQHKGKLQGRNQLIWLGAGRVYSLHQDLHSPIRYHIPFVTHKDCYWKFVVDKVICQIHMPADNRVWFVNTATLMHTVVNDSPISRCHLLISSCK